LLELPEGLIAQIDLQKQIRQVAAQAAVQRVEVERAPEFGRVGEAAGKVIPGGLGDPHIRRPRSQQPGPQRFFGLARGFTRASQVEQDLERPLVGWDEPGRQVAIRGLGGFAALFEQPGQFQLHGAVVGVCFRSLRPALDRLAELAIDVFEGSARGVADLRVFACLQPSEQLQGACFALRLVTKEG
jgi:hypothetical protein